ncbi:hypothetical protein BVX95_00690 [archaeon D22]|nr:hypothetical protein BVX95_00690 [archaeon D22]
MVALDKINCKILNLLQENCRISLTDIAKKTNLSIDSVKKRVDKLSSSNLYVPKIQMRPRYFGYDNVVDVKIKLSKYSENDLAQFVEYLTSNHLIVEVIAISGEWDFTIVFIAKNSIEINEISNEIKTNFSHIIDKWSESLTTKVYKFEKYDMLKILNLNENE